MIVKQPQRYSIYLTGADSEALVVLIIENDKRLAALKALCYDSLKSKSETLVKEPRCEECSIEASIILFHYL